MRNEELREFVSESVSEIIVNSFGRYPGFFKLNSKEKNFSANETVNTFRFSLVSAISGMKLADWSITLKKEFSPWVICGDEEL